MNFFSGKSPLIVSSQIKCQIVGLLTIADHKPPTTNLGKENWQRMALETLLRAELARIEKEEYHERG